MTLPLPYIGITGIVTDRDVATVQRCVEAIPTHHRLMAGVLVSRKSLSHEFTSNRRYPEIIEANALLEGCRDAGAWPVVHYNSQARDVKLLAELEVLQGYCPAMRGLQLNVVTPDPATVEGFALGHPEIEVILQVNGASLKVTGLSPLGYVQTYRGIKHALLDASGGTGKALKPDATYRDVRMAYVPLRVHGVSLGIAGGLGPSMPELATMLGLCRAHGIAPRDLSFDAESALQVPVLDPYDNEPFQDKLDPVKALAYVESVCRLL